jgi:glycosyltransferase involved in cell wall biosynthesis
VAERLLGSSGARLRVRTPKRSAKTLSSINGDLVGMVVELAAALGIGRHVTLTGSLNGRDVSRLLHMADLYVMPSVSEPFGIAPLEALAHDVPVIVSKQSGVSEVLQHALKVDFWDTGEMANKIVSALTRPALHQALRENGGTEVRSLTWANAARRCMEVYHSLLRRPQGRGSRHVSPLAPGSLWEEPFQ